MCVLCNKVIIKRIDIFITTGDLHLTPGPRKPGAVPLFHQITRSCIQIYINISQHIMWAGFQHRCEARVTRDYLWTRGTGGFSSRPVQEPKLENCIIMCVQGLCKCSGVLQKYRLPRLGSSYGMGFRPPMGVDILWQGRGLNCR